MRCKPRRLGSWGSLTPTRRVSRCPSAAAHNTPENTGPERDQSRFPSDTAGSPRRDVPSEPRSPAQPARRRKRPAVVQRAGREFKHSPLNGLFPLSSAFKAPLAAGVLFIIPRKSELRLSHSAGFSGDCCSGSWNVHGIIFISLWEGFFFVWFGFTCCMSPSVPREVREARGLWLSNALPRCRWCGCLCLRVPVGEGGGCRQRRPNSRGTADVACRAVEPQEHPLCRSLAPCLSHPLLREALRRFPSPPRLLPSARRRHPSPRRSITPLSVFISRIEAVSQQLRQ